MTPMIIKKHPATRAAHYFFLLPFLPALRPLLIHPSLVDLVIYLTGFLLIASLIIYGNHRPLLKAGEYNLSLDLHYRHQWEVHPYEEILGYRKISKSHIALHSLGHQPVILKIPPGDAVKLTELLESKEIHQVSHAKAQT